MSSWGRPPPWRHVFFRRLVRREIDQELSFHLDMRASEERLQGLDESRAREASLRRFGDVEKVRHECREIGEERVKRYRRWEMFDSLRQDVRFAIRNLRRRPGFVAVVVVTLALGIGATTAIFSVVDGVLLRPLPFHEPDRLVFIFGIEEGMKTGSGWMSYPDWRDFLAEVETVEGIAVSGQSNPGAVTITSGDAPPTNVEVARASSDLFSVLGISPVLGRTFLPEEDRVGGERVVILGHGFWRDRTGADPDVVGRDVVLNGEPYRVVGVMPDGFDYPGVRLWLPLEPGYADDSRGMHRLLPVARLKPGVSIAHADAEVRAIAARLEAAYPETNTARTATVVPIRERLLGRAEPRLFLLLGVVAVVLLIATLNVANLLLVRAAPREREVAVRATLGAGRPRLVRQLITESVALATVGGILGIGLAFAAVRLLVGAAPAGIPRIDEVTVDARVLVFALLLTGLTGVLCGLLPAWSASRPDLQECLKEGTGRQTAGKRLSRWSAALVVFEVAFAVLLVAGAGLLTHSLLLLESVDPGYHEQRVVVVPLGLSDNVFDAEYVTGFYDGLLERVRSLPGVEAAALGYQPPLVGGWESSFQIPGVFERSRGERPEARIRPVTPGYFRTVGIPLRAGREFDERDAADGPGVVVVNESFARTFLDGRDPLAHSVAKGNWWGEERPAEYRIVGVVADVKMDGLDAQTPWALYFLHAQWPFSDMYLFARTAADPHGVVPAIREAVWAIDPTVPVENVSTLPELRAGAVAEERFLTLLVGVFSGLALVLAAVGVFGVLSHSAAQRAPEMGVRMAVGARSTDVLRLVVGRGLRLTSLGLFLGLAASIAASRLVRGLLFEVSPTDPMALGSATLLLAAVALVACAVPAIRVSRLSPSHVLRTE